MRETLVPYRWSWGTARPEGFRSPGLTRRLLIATHKLCFALESSKDILIHESDLPPLRGYSSSIVIETIAPY